ncbi:unnamed protein product [Effrenium voratum]|uniref:Uncharacterized protein n=1 Tax=Effrenium voratum TaxID=2562239 RepID=A0AA36IRJ5_9DINO|nr:unnamed protein product [Effrenium voratum]CAJ1455820.1 unnamed protein product [Effrenium voratum]
MRRCAVGLCGSCVVACAVLQLRQLQLLPEDPSPMDPAVRMDVSAVGIYVQAANPALWNQMYQCIDSVVQAHGGPVDVFVSTLNESVAELYRSNLTAASSRLRRWEVQVLENRGADLGQFFQQVLREPMDQYEAVLKIHTKKLELWRNYILENLCASPAVVKRALEALKDPKVHMAGPKEFIFLGGKATFSQAMCDIIQCRTTKVQLFPKQTVQAMERAWPLLGQAVPFHGTSRTLRPPARRFAIVAGSCFWLRGHSTALAGNFTANLPRLLGNMTLAYRPRSAHQIEHAVERLLPTLVYSSGGLIARLSA